MKILLSSALIVSLFIFTTGCSKKDESSAPESTTFTAVTTITDKDGNVYTIGYDQVSSNNQDAYLQKKNAGGQTVWRKIYDGSPIDSRGVWITLDANQDPWVVFSADGGSGGSTAFNQKEVEANAFTGVYKSGYGAGGGPRVVIAAHINRETGKIFKGSYLGAKLTDGNTNSISADKIGINGGRMVLEVTSAYKPPAAGGTGNFTEHPDATEENKQGSYWKLRMVFSADFSRLEESVVLK